MRKDCWIRGDGPLVPFAEAFRVELEEAGHPSGSVKHYLLLMGRLNRWLVAEEIGVESLTTSVAQDFLDSKRDAVRAGSDAGIVEAALFLLGTGECLGTGGAG